MRYLARFILAATFALALPLPLAAQGPAAVTQLRPAVEPARLAAVVDWLTGDVERGRIPGAVILVARDGKILLHEAVGYADKDKKVP